MKLHPGKYDHLIEKQNSVIKEKCKECKDVDMDKLENKMYQKYEEKMLDDQAKHLQGLRHVQNRNKVQLIS